MALSRQWYTRGNIALSDNSTVALTSKSMLWALKALLMGHHAGATLGPEGAPPAGSYWTCEGSSDGATAGMDASDRWTSSFDASKIVRASGAVAHSWIVLKSPAAMGPVYMLISYNTTQDYNVAIYMSNTAYTGGSITVRPTSTQEWTVTSSTQFVENAVHVGVAHFSVDADGNFFFLGSRTGTGIFNFFFAAQEVIDPRAGEASPVFSMLDYVATSRGAPNTPAVAGRNMTNAAADTNLGYVRCQLNAGGAQLASITTVNPLTAAWETFPVFIASTTTSFAGFRGKVPDLALVAGATVGGSEPTTGTPERTLAASFLVPYSLVPAL